MMAESNIPTILEVDAITGLETVRNLTAKEIADIESAQSEAQVKIASRESALAKLAALGLTEEEIAAL